MREGQVYARSVNPDTIYEHIGGVIKRRRKELGLKQQDLAERLGISRGSLANIETGKQGVLVHHLYNYANALDLAPTDFLMSVEQSTAEAAWADRLPANLNAEQREQIARLLDNRAESAKSRGKRRGK